MTKESPGYPLPDGDLGGDDIVCQLVYLPDRDEYWQAFFAAYHYMTNWLAWERDSDKRGKDAAGDWRIAFELTMECWRMTCLDEITDRLDVMIDLLGNQPGCCGATTIGPIITVVTTIVPGEGDDPTHWGETEVEDWDEWSEYVCYHAHQYVDTLVNSAKALDLVTELGNWTIEFFVDLTRTLLILPLGYPVSFTDMIERYEAFRNEDIIEGKFDGIGDKIEAAREDIVCSIMWGTSLSDAVEDAIDDNAVWLLFYKFTDYSAVQAVIYEGTADGTEYLPPVKRDDCDCGLPALFEYEWVEDDLQGWENDLTWESGNLRFHPESAGSYHGNWNNETSETVAARFGISHPMVVNRVEADVMFWAGNTPPEPLRYTGMYLTVHSAAGDHDSPEFIHGSPHPTNEWFHVVWEIGEDITLYRASGGVLQVFTRCTVLTPNQGVFVQNLKYIYV